ncbi:MAG: NAD(P)/FAD-dependent oxidoreductase [Myxococcota bacterium]
MPRDRRAVIVGAGITGTLTARNLARAGWDVTILEAAHVGAGSSSRTAAGIRQQWSTEPTVRGMRFAVRFYNEWRQRTGGDSIPLRPNGYLFLSGDEAHFEQAQRRVAMQQSAGLHDVQALDMAGLRAMFPWVGEEGVVGGTFCPSDGFLLPSMVYQDGMADARAHGAVLIQGAPVESGTTSNGTIKSLNTPKGAFEADIFIDCTNAWSKALARSIGAEELPVDPLKRYLWFVRREGSMTPDQLSQMPLTITPSGVYCRPENEDSLLMGHAHPTRSEDGFSYEDQDVIEPDFAHTGGLEAAPFESWMSLAEVLPPIGEFAGITATTSGYYGTTPDHNPFFGFDRQLTNYLRLVGFSGHGAMFGPFSAAVGAAFCEAGEDMASVDIEGETIDLAAFSIGRDHSSHEAMVI